MSRIAWSWASVEYVCDPGCLCLICRLEQRVSLEDAGEPVLDYMETCAWPHRGIGRRARRQAA